jgi:hypothetical protein
VRTKIGIFPALGEASGNVTLLLRPDAVQLADNLPCQMTGMLADISFRGGSVQARLEVNGQPLELHFPAYVDLPPVGSQMTVGFEPEAALQVFSEQLLL